MTREEAREAIKEAYGNSEYTDEIIKALEQEPVIDNIRTEIEQLTSRYTISRERGGMGQVEWSEMLIKESEVLEIIDKYKGKSEG